MVCIVLSGLSAPALAAQVSGYLSATSDYVHRGVSQSDGHGALQLGVDLAFDTGFYLGAWGSTVDIGGGTSRYRDRQVNYYLGYGYDMSSKWTLGVNAVAYTYPGGEGQIDYDYLEYSLSANYQDRAWIEYSHSPDLYHTGQSTDALSLYTEWPLGRQFTLGAGVGIYDVSDLLGDDYAYWQLGVSRPFEHITLDLRYHDTNRAVPYISFPDTAESRIVLSATYQF